MDGEGKEMSDEIELSDDAIAQYVNKAFSEQVIQNYEDQLLAVMKHRQEKYPSEKNDREWLDYTNFVCRRRCQRSENARD